MRLSEIWINEDCGVTTRTHELVMDFDNNWRLSVNLQNELNGGGLDALEFADALSRASDAILVSQAEHRMNDGKEPIEFKL